MGSTAFYQNAESTKHVVVTRPYQIVQFGTLSQLAPRSNCGVSFWADTQGVHEKGVNQYCTNVVAICVLVSPKPQVVTPKKWKVLHMTDSLESPTKRTHCLRNNHSHFFSQWWVDVNDLYHLPTMLIFFPTSIHQHNIFFWCFHATKPHHFCSAILLHLHIPWSYFTCI